MSIPSVGGEWVKGGWGMAKDGWMVICKVGVDAFPYLPLLNPKCYVAVLFSVLKCSYHSYTLVQTATEITHATRILIFVQKYILSFKS